MGHSEGEKIRKTILHRDVALMCAAREGLRASESARTHMDDGHIIGGEKFIFIPSHRTAEGKKHRVYNAYLKTKHVNSHTGTASISACCSWW